MNLPHLLIALRASYWFMPSVLVLASGLLAVLMVEVDVLMPSDFLDDMPRLFGANAEGSRALLSAIATSTMTVAGVVFSITIVSLSLATAQYSPHVLQKFIRDRHNQIVLGIFLGIFTYCLIVLRTVRGGQESFVPGASILVAILLALTGVGFLIFFIHHVAVSIQVSHIISDIAAETRGVIERIYPDGHQAGEAQEEPQRDEPDDGGFEVPQLGPPGYIESIDYDSLADIAAECGALMRVPVAVGDFVLTDQALVVVHGAASVEDKLKKRVRRAFAIGNERNIDQDVAFGLQQLVDIACRALSSSNNDTTTAIHALQHLTVLLSMLAARKLGARHIVRRGDRPVLVGVRPDFTDFVLAVAGPFRRRAREYPLVLQRLVSLLDRVGGATSRPQDLAVVMEHVGSLEEVIRDAGFDTADAHMLDQRLSDATRGLRALSYERRRRSDAADSAGRRST